MGNAVRIAIESHPEASRNSALLVRLVWQIRDGYRTEPTQARLTDPGSIVRALFLFRRAFRSDV